MTHGAVPILAITKSRMLGTASCSTGPEPSQSTAHRKQIEKMERMSLRTQRQVKAPIKPGAFFVPSRNVLLQRKCACGGKPRAGGECEECRKKRLQAQTSDTLSAIKNESHLPNMHEVIRSQNQPLDAESRSTREPQFGHDFGKLHVHSDAKAADSAVSVAGQFPPGPQPEPPTSDTKPIPMDNPSPT